MVTQWCINSADSLQNGVSLGASMVAFRSKAKTLPNLCHVPVKHLSVTRTRSMACLYRVSAIVTLFITLTRMTTIHVSHA